MNRQQSNLKIIDILQENILAQPDIRFFQLLYNLGIKEVEPLYNQESSKTLEQLQNKNRPIKNKIKEWIKKLLTKIT